ncbi:TPA: acyl carrier protein, partial [Streptococcus pneumoniae]
MHDIVLNVVESVMQQQIKPDENLLDTGLNSLNSVEIILELEERLNIDLGSLNLYVNSSIEEITKFIEKSQKSSGLKLTTIVEPKIKLK